ncbi:helix-turn-helix domain-containing protein [Spongiivirga sp. MCCC 1A20706]|uniref:DUF4870 domain-containing protein n=1 Tax=Spongiivirga sp. MCCC 1A20706 TaxID=3160963 RepID=UPI003977B792
MEQQSIARNLLYQRKLKGLTQEELSEKTQVTVRTIQRIEKGDVSPHLQTVKLLAVGLDIELNALMPLDNPNEETLQKKWLLLIHGTPFLGLVIPFCNVLFPLFLWIHKADDNKIYDDHGRAAVNFHATVTLTVIISLVFFFILPGFNFIATIAILLLSITITLVNIVRALNDQKYWYPLSIPFLRKKKKMSSNSSH